MLFCLLHPPRNDPPGSSTPMVAEGFANLPDSLSKTPNDETWWGRIHASEGVLLSWDARRNDPLATIPPRNFTPLRLRLAGQPPTRWPMVVGLTRQEQSLARVEQVICPARVAPRNDAAEQEPCAPSGAAVSSPPDWFANRGGHWAANPGSGKGLHRGGIGCVSGRSMFVGPLVEVAISMQAVAISATARSG